MRQEEIARLKARIDELWNALEPFASAAANFRSETPACNPLTDNELVHLDIEWRHYARAADALGL